MRTENSRSEWTCWRLYFPERAGQYRKRGAVDARAEGGRQVAFEKRDGVLRLGEDGFKKAVVGMGGGSEGFCGFFHAAEIHHMLCQGKMLFSPPGGGYSAAANASSSSQRA